MGALPTDRKPLAVANTLVTTDFDFALDVILNVTTEVTLNRQVGINP